MPAPTANCTASGLVPSGSLLHSTTFSTWPGPEKPAATILGAPSAEMGVGKGWGPTSAYHSGWARRSPWAKAVGLGAHRGVYPTQFVGLPCRLMPAVPAAIAWVM